jgi:hypothetical protein
MAADEELLVGDINRGDDDAEVDERDDDDDVEKGDDDNEDGDGEVQHSGGDDGDGDDGDVTADANAALSDGSPEWFNVPEYDSSSSE